MISLNTFYTRYLLLFIMGAGSMDGQSQIHPDPAEDQDYNLQLDRAIAWQEKADSVYHISIEWRKQADKTDDPLERGRLQQRIVTIEDSMRVYQDRADRYFAVLVKPSSPFITLDTIIQEIRVYNYNLTDEFLATMKEIEQEEVTAEDITKTDINASIEFKIFPTPYYSKDHPFEHDFIPSPGIFYRIQMAVYRSEVLPKNFGGLYPITTEKIPDKGMTRYFVGKFTKLDNARTALQKVRSAGFSDAFIIGYYDGVIGTLERLGTLEKER